MNTTTVAGNGVNFSPQQAAALLDHTTRQARRQFQPSPPWLLATRAVLVLAVLGSVWFSVRGQHPYHGPTAANIPVLVAFIVANFTATVTVRLRANAGVRGKSRFSRTEITILALAWASEAALIAVLAAAGSSLAQHPTTVLIIPGLAWTAISAARHNRASLGTGIAVTITGLAGAFAGPAGAWLVGGVGLCATLLGRAGITARRQHA
jgi:hypothetical protein